MSAKSRKIKKFGPQARIVTSFGALLSVIAVAFIVHASYGGSDAYAQSTTSGGSSAILGAHSSAPDSTNATTIRPSQASSAAMTTKTTSATSKPVSAGSSLAATNAKVVTNAAISQTTDTSVNTISAATATAPPATGGASSYPLHTGIRTTYFYVGEPADADNDYIQNVSSAWQDNWQTHYGGVDNPDSRCGYNPCAFTPKENPFYFALPFADYNDDGSIADLTMVYWNNPSAPMQNGQTIIKNRWIQITAAPGGVSKTVYAQWEDVGPFNEHDSEYVFGSAGPAYSQAGLDVSPATRDYLGMAGSTTSSWRFVDASDVPNGPWKTTITTSGIDWQ
jgi:hypothetical protein